MKLCRSQTLTMQMLYFASGMAVPFIVLKYYLIAWIGRYYPEPKSFHHLPLQPPPQDLSQKLQPIGSLFYNNLVIIMCAMFCKFLYYTCFSLLYF